MPRFAANLSMLYGDVPLIERIACAAQDGFQGVECLFPYAVPANAWREALQSAGVEQVLFNAPPGGMSAQEVDAAWARGDRGTACLPERTDEFRAGIHMALDHAQAIACPLVHVMAGVLPAGVERAALQPTYVANLRWAAAQAALRGITLTIEPINQRDMPGYFLNRQDHAHEILELVGAPNLKVQMDLYHCQVVEGDVASKLRQHLPTGRVAHLQIAGVPERHEPDVGELNHRYLFDLIDSLSASAGWPGWVGCEYRPGAGNTVAATREGLARWRAALLG
jgi:2-dehydrotetronate isomerase